MFGLSADAAGTDTKITAANGLVTVYVVHNVENGATAAQFRVEAPTGWALVSAQAEFDVSLGNVTTGVSLGYGSCLTGAIHLMTLMYQSPGTSGGSFNVLPHTDTG